jgi:hypothetical protein
MWLSPEPLTAPTAAPIRFDSLEGFVPCSFCLLLCLFFVVERESVCCGAPYVEEVEAVSSIFVTESDRWRRCFATAGRSGFERGEPVTSVQPPLLLGTVSTYWSIEGVPGGGGDPSSERAEAGATSANTLMQMTAM